MATGIVPQPNTDATDFVPEVFGRLTTLGAGYLVDFGKYRKTCHKVQCQCGMVLQVRRNSLLSGNTKSCGCLDMDLKKTRTTNGHHRGGLRTPEAEAYSNMLKRCYNERHKDYPNYGGRGIKVFPEWRGPGGFERWLAHIGLKSHPKLTQERDDVNGNYEPGNVRWATKEEQANNTRANVLIVYLGQTKNLTQWAKTTGIHWGTIRSRLASGWAIEDALTIPPKYNNKNPKG